MLRYPGAIWYPSPVSHPPRPDTRGIVIHWTAGRKAGDLATLTGGHVDVQFYVDKAGEVYQLLDADSEAWHAFATANDHTIGIEHEGSGEPWTPEQLAASAKLVAWLTTQFGIPVKHTDPHSDWNGIYGHADLKGIDGNDHVDTVPAGTGWDKFLAAVTAASPKPAKRPRPQDWKWARWYLGLGEYARFGRRAKGHRPPYPRIVGLRGWTAVRWYLKHVVQV